MGVAQSVLVTGTTMFHHKFLLFVCAVALSTPNPQSYFHNFGNQGTYASVNHGPATGVHQPAPAAYKQPAQVYSNPGPAYGQTAYHAPPPAPTVKSFYHAPVAKPAAYHAPLPNPMSTTTSLDHPTSTHAPMHSHAPMARVLNMTGRSVLWTMWRRKLKSVCPHLRLIVRQKMLRMAW
eukprot:TRINITY_DN436_c0_g1_i16.p1 TRINITY_DN436_c0_g1~~TRINITY_DN436_c0_g1_i16.p1  ORF type:complete len:186 (-),score=36.43 TRINITY_DN436_c0_g1_i16:57-590(-)